MIPWQEIHLWHGSSKGPDPNPIQGKHLIRWRFEQGHPRSRIYFGGMDQIFEEPFEARGSHLVESTLQDLRYGLRGMRKQPSFLIIAALTLALGIGASAAVFSLVNTILLKRLAYPNAEQVMMLWREVPLAGVGDMAWSPGEYRALTQAETAFQDVGAFKKVSFNLTGTSDPELLEGVRASAGFFRALGVLPFMGRTFTNEEDQPGHEHVVVLSYRLWRNRFGGSVEILGKSLDLSGESYTVIGVMPESFTFPNQEGIPPVLDLPKETQLWVPIALPSAPTGSNELGVIVRLKADAPASRLEQQLIVLEKELEENLHREKGWSCRAVPLGRQLTTDARRPLLLLLGAVTVVLLIACANVSGLTLNRQLGRRRELTLRGALGARRGRLVRQLMTESLLLAFVGGAIGILFGDAILYLAKHFGPDSIPHLHEVGLDLRVIAYVIGITLAAGVLFGSAPALGASRTNMVEALKEGGQRSVGSSTAPKLRNLLLIAQVAMALVLVIAAGLLVRTFYSMLHSSAGFDAARVSTFELSLPTPKYADPDRMVQLYQQVLLHLQAIPAVQGAGFASVVPMGGAPDSTVIRIPEHPAINPSEQPYVNYLFVSPGYFTTMGTPLRYGRDVRDTDTLNSVPVAIVSSSLARKYFHNGNPVGKQLGVGSTKYPLRTIIGVVADSKRASLREEPSPEMFVPYSQNEIKIWPSMQSMEFVVRTKGNSIAIAESVRDAVHSADPDLPVAKFTTMTALVEGSLTADRFSMLLVGSFGVLALIMASIGMYGVISYSVMQRTPEIGIRMALGAKKEQIFLMVLRQGGILAGAGIAIGLIAAFAATRLMQNFLYDVHPTDPITFVIVSLVLAIIGLLACYTPARKAMKVNPIVALRYE